jgi:hypothetical protein
MCDNYNTADDSSKSRAFEAVTITGYSPVLTTGTVFVQTVSIWERSAVKRSDNTTALKRNGVSQRGLGTSDE